MNYQIGNYLGPRMLRGERSWLFNRNTWIAHVGLPTLRREDDHPRPVHPDRADVRSVRRRGGFDELLEIPGLQRSGRHPVGAGLRHGRLLVLAEMPVVKKNFSLVILAIIVLSVLPAVWEFWRHRMVRLAPRRRNRLVFITRSGGWHWPRPCLRSSEAAVGPVGADGATRRPFQGLRPWLSISPLRGSGTGFAMH